MTLMNTPTLNKGQFGDFPAPKQLGKGDSCRASSAFPGKKEATVKTECRREQMGVTSNYCVLIYSALFPEGREMLANFSCSCGQ